MTTSLSSFSHFGTFSLEIFFPLSEIVFLSMDFVSLGFLDNSTALRAGQYILHFLRKIVYMSLFKDLSTYIPFGEWNLLFKSYFGCLVHDSLLKYDTYWHKSFEWASGGNVKSGKFFKTASVMSVPRFRLFVPVIPLTRPHQTAIRQRNQVHSRGYNN